MKNLGSFRENSLKIPGNALKFYTSTRIDIRRLSSIKVGDVAVGMYIFSIFSKKKLL